MVGLESKVDSLAASLKVLRVDEVQIADPKFLCTPISVESRCSLFDTARLMIAFKK
jgi:hypothetical protein